MEIGGLRVLLYPLYHPAAALYTRSMLSTLEGDFARIPELLASAIPGRDDGPAAAAPAPPPAAIAPERPAAAAMAAADEQLGLF